MSNIFNLRAHAIREVRLANPTRINVERANAALSSLSRASHDVDELQKQADLLHIECVLVTEGLNDNDDAFTHAELKQALNSPVLKPMNWQHKDDNIIGAMYAVEARDLDGNVLGEIGDGPIELVVQGAVWHHLPHIKTTAEQIVKRIAEGDLFVSMECWFDDYDFGIYNQDGSYHDLITRNKETAFLDRYLKAAGGVGRYKDRRIGRALKGINFGGIAFVDRPANKRSFILNHFAFDPSAPEVVGAGNDDLNQRVVPNNVVIDYKSIMEENMNDQNRTAASNREDIRDAVVEAMTDERKAHAAQALTVDYETAQRQVAKLEADLTAKSDELESVRAAIDEAFAGATANTPPEIQKIDDALNVKGAGAGKATWAAKLDWLTSSRSAAALALEEAVKGGDADVDVEKLVEQNATLKQELASLKGEIRETEIRYLFEDKFGMDEDEVKVFVEAGLSKETDEAYKAWMDEKIILARTLLAKKDKKGPGYKGDKNKENLDKLRKQAAEDVEAGLLAPSDSETPVDDYGALLRPRNGRMIRDISRTPRSKLTAAENIDELFEDSDEPNLAGAAGGVGDGKSPMGRLVANLFDKPEKAVKNTN